MAMTYTSLVAQLQDYLQRTDDNTINAIPNFIFLAHHKACIDIKNLGLEQYTNGIFIGGAQQGGAVIPKPGLWRRTISFNYGKGTNYQSRVILQPRSYEWLVNYGPDRTVTGEPLYYADYGFNNWYISPTPDLSYPFEVSWIGLPQPLNDNYQTNWFTNFAPQLLFYGSMLQALIFIRSMELLPVYQSLYQDAVDKLNIQDSGRVEDRTTNRDAD